MTLWPTVSLIDVCQITMGQAPIGDSYNDLGNGIALIAGAGDFGEGIPASKKFTTAPTKRCLEGDIVVGIRASIGEQVMADREYCLGRGVAGLRPREHLHVRYLWHWLKANRDLLAAKGRGATFKQVNRKDIAELELALPSMGEQRRIAEILDRGDAIYAKRCQALKILDDLTQSTFLNMFGSDLGRDSSLADVVATGTIVTYGIVQAGSEYAGGVPYIRTGDLAGGEIRTTGLRHTAPEIAARFGRSTVRAGDIVMSIRATVGATALVPAELDGANLTQGTARIAPGKLVEREFLLEYLRSPQVQAWIERQTKGATFREITLARLRDLPMSVPDLNRQSVFARLWQRVRRQRAAMVESKQTADRLLGSLQQRAFTGQL